MQQNLNEEEERKIIINTDSDTPSPQKPLNG